MAQNTLAMFQQIIVTVRRADLLSLIHVHPSRLFTTSIPRGRKLWALVPPEDRRHEYNRQMERYNTDEAFRTRVRLRIGAYRRVKLDLLSEDEKYQRVLLESFRRFVRRGLKRAGYRIGRTTFQKSWAKM